MSVTEHDLPVYAASTFRVAFGVKEGEPLSKSDALLMDDRYELEKGSKPSRLRLIIRADGQFETLIDGQLQPVVMDCLLRFMCPDGRLHDALLLHVGAGLYLSPLHPLSPRISYTLMGIDHARPREVFARIGAASFAKGTQITLPCGTQQAVETLQPGDKVLTRDDGAQPIRWIGHSTQRATGAMAPIEIAPGALHNADTLTVSPAHHLFFYQRRDALGLGQSELGLRAQDLLGSDGVIRKAGGFIDYVQLVFDRHQVIYAEGIAAESMRIDARAAPLVTPALARMLGPRHAKSDLGTCDLALPQTTDRAAELRAGSTS